MTHGYNVAVGSTKYHSKPKKNKTMSSEYDNLTKQQIEKEANREEVTE